MIHRSTHAGAVRDSLLALQSRRVRQLILLLMAALGVFAVINLTLLEARVQAPLVAGIALLGVALWMQQRGRVEQSLMMVLWVMTFVAMAMIWMRGGIRDLVVLAYPCILVLAAMALSPRRLVALGGAMVLSLGLLAWGEISGWYQPNVPPVGPWSFVNRALILVVVAVIGRTMARDLQAAVARAESESSRAKDSAVRLAFLVQHDALTGLPNRLLVQDRFAQALARSRRDGTPLAMLVIDLDDFRRVNDSLGHGVGDAVLQRMAERLRVLAAETDTLGRLGADEFVVVSAELGDAEALAVFAQRLLDGLAEPFERDGLCIACGSSIGIARFPYDGDTFETLLNRAEAAMARAKADGRNAFRFADAEVDLDVGEHLRLVSELRAGIDRGELELHYQPIVHLASGRVGAVEALMRWRHPERGMVSPGAFIPLAERSGLIHPLGAWALEEAAAQARRWEARGLPPLVVSVNVSPVQLAQGELDVVVQRVLAANALPAKQLLLELTESSLVGDAEPLRNRITRLRAIGVGLSIDDFGTGYSNLGYLQRFDVQALKIDQRFVRGLADGPQGEASVRAIAQLAGSLGIRTVAEGIETAEEAQRLQALGCDAGQGHWWGDAMPAAVFTRWYAERFTELAAQVSQR
ncbi:MAG: putative bifunctional diguanylate cyclase/phosphodiesterase [Lysobacteraceae bacterium]